MASHASFWLVQTDVIGRVLFGITCEFLVGSNRCYRQSIFWHHMPVSGCFKQMLSAECCLASHARFLVGLNRCYRESVVWHHMPGFSLVQTDVIGRVLSGITCQVSGWFKQMLSAEYCLASHASFLLVQTDVIGRVLFGITCEYLVGSNRFNRQSIVWHHMRVSGWFKQMLSAECCLASHARFLFGSNRCYRQSVVWHHMRVSVWFKQLLSAEYCLAHTRVSGWFKQMLSAEYCLASHARFLVGPNRCYRRSIVLHHMRVSGWFKQMLSAECCLASHATFWLVQTDLIGRVLFCITCEFLVGSNRCYRQSVVWHHMPGFWLVQTDVIGSVLFIITCEFLVGSNRCYRQSVVWHHMPGFWLVQTDVIGKELFGITCQVSA